MAVNIGAAFGGFARGLGQGLQTGVDIVQKQEQLELQKAEGKLRMMSALNNLSNMPEEARKAFGPAIIKQFEKAYGTEIPEPLKAVFIKGNTEQNKKMIETLMKAASDPKFDISKVGEVIGSMPLDKQLDVVKDVVGLKFKRESLEEQKRHSRASEALQGAALATPERQAFAALKTDALKRGLSEADAAREAFQKLREEKTTSPEVITYNSEYQRIKKENPNISDADARTQAFQRVQELKAEAGKTPIAKLHVDLRNAKTPEERAAIQAEIDEQKAKSQKAQADALRVTGDAKLLDEASKKMETITSRIIDKDGKVNRGIVNALSMNVPFTEGRNARNTLRQSLIDYVFARSGKQVAVAEMENFMRTYMPSALDNDQTIRDKLGNLRRNLDILSGKPPSEAPAKPPSTTKSGLKYREQ